MRSRPKETVCLIGQWLTECKTKLPHGYWLPWLKTEFGWSHDTARNFMQVWGCCKLRDFRNLQIDASALYLITQSKTPEPVRQEVIRRAQSGEHRAQNPRVETNKS
jgi:hypothetical protein